MSYEDMGNAAADIGLKINVTADTSQAVSNMDTLSTKTEFLHSKYIMLA